MRTIRFVLVFCCVAANSICFCQTYGYFDVRSGFGEFVLGAPKLRFDSTIKPAGEGGMGKRRMEYPYYYLPAKTNPYELANVSFSDILIFFDQADTLFRIMLIKTYLRQQNANYEDSARSDFKSLDKLLRACWDKKPKKKIVKYNLNIDTSSNEYSWEDGKRLMFLSLYENKKKGFLSITLSLENKN